MNVGGFFQKIAPWLAAGVQFVPGAGPTIAGVINKIAADHGVELAAPADHTLPDTIENAVAALTGNAQALAALKKQDQDYALQMQAAGFKQIDDLIALGDADRANARAREIQIKDHVPAILAFVITVGFFGTLWYVFGHGVKPEAHDLAIGMVNVLGTAWVGVVTYYFGSSAGSDAKTKIIGDIAKS